MESAKLVFKSKMYQTLRSQPGAVSWPGAVMIPWGPYVGMWTKQMPGGRGNYRRMVWKRMGSTAEWRMSVPAGKGWKFRDNFARNMAAALRRPATTGQPYRPVEGLVVSLYRQILRGIPADVLKMLRSKEKIGERHFNKVTLLRRLEMLRLAYFLGTKRAADLHQRDPQLALLLAKKLQPGQPFAPSVRLDQILAKATGLRRKEARRVLRWNSEWRSKNYSGAVKTALLVRDIGVAVTTEQARAIANAMDSYDRPLILLARPYMRDVLRSPDIHGTLREVRDELIHPLVDGEKQPKTLAALLEKHQQRYAAMRARQPLAGTFKSPGPRGWQDALAHFGFYDTSWLVADQTLVEMFMADEEPQTTLAAVPLPRHPVLPDDWSACGYRGRRLPTLQATADESDRMSHCVRSHGQSLLTGVSAVWHIEKFDGSDGHTLEVRRDGSIVDFRGRFNAPTTKGAASAVRELFGQYEQKSVGWFEWLDQIIGVAVEPVAQDEWGWVVRPGQREVVANHAVG